MESGLKEGIVKRYTKGHATSPFSRGQLLEDVSFKGEGPKVDDLLHGECNFPDDCPEPARVLCRAAAKISKDSG